MKVQDTIKELREQITELETRIKWLENHEKVLENLPEGSYCGGTLDFDALPHEKVIQVIRKLGGKWSKSKNDVAPGEIGQGIDYVTTIDGMRVRCWAGQPPPSCRWVEIEEVIPAQVIPAKVIPEQRRVVKKLICTGDDPLLVSMAQKLDPRPTTK